MPSTIVLKITKKMNCGSCTGKVKAALEGLAYVTSARVDLETQTATCEVKEGACKCEKTGGACPCGADCQCAQKDMKLTLSAIGYSSEVGACGAGAGACPAQAAGTCTCGPNCQCGPNCSCASCPGKCGAGAGACPAKAKGTCTCGPNCQCGPDCKCASCPGKKGSAVAATCDLLLKLGLAGALLAVGFAAGKRFG